MIQIIARVIVHAKSEGNMKMDNVKVQKVGNYKNQGENLDIFNYRK